jgi:hypothetical protein
VNQDERDVSIRISRFEMPDNSGGGGGGWGISRYVSSCLLWRGLMFVCFLMLTATQLKVELAISVSTH